MKNQKKNDQNNKIGIPIEQIQYDPVKIKERINKIKRKRIFINNSLTAVSFLLIIMAVVLLALFFLNGNTVHVESERILGNLKEIYQRNGKEIAEHTLTNFTSIKGVAAATLFASVIPNFLYLSTGIKELASRIGANIYPEQSAIQLFAHNKENVQPAIKGCQHLYNAIGDNFVPVAKGVKEIITDIVEKIQQLR